MATTKRVSIKEFDHAVRESFLEVKKDIDSLHEMHTMMLARLAALESRISKDHATKDDLKEAVDSLKTTVVLTDKAGKMKRIKNAFRDFFTEDISVPKPRA